MKTHPSRRFAGPLRRRLTAALTPAATGAATGAATLTATLTATAAQAHTGPITGPIWRAWNAEPLIWTLSILAAGLYIRGLTRRRLQVAPWRSAFFLIGLGFVVIALESPLDAMADHSYWMHQVQHLLIRMMGPMLMLLAAPQAVIFAGVPRRIRRVLITGVAANGPLQRLGRELVRPFTATVLFIGSLYVWQLPALHNTAILNNAVHYAMHVTMLTAGILFFWVLFDRRDAPKGVPHPARIGMLLAAILAQLLIGAGLTLKPMVLYPAYDVAGRLWDMTPISDEITGGFIMWAPSCMMLLLPLIFVTHLWNGVEERRWQRQGPGSNMAAAMLVPETADELWIAVRAKNTRLALSLALFPPALFAMAVGAVEAAHLAH